MNKINILILSLLCGFLVACNKEQKKTQMVIPQAQLDALNKAKNLEGELLKSQQQQEILIQKQLN